MRETPLARGSYLGVLVDEIDRSNHRVVELRTQPDSFAFIPPHCLREFLRGRWADANGLHRPRTSLAIRRFTSSQDSRGIAPDSMAAMRR